MMMMMIMMMGIFKRKSVSMRSMLVTPWDVGGEEGAGDR